MFSEINVHIGGDTKFATHTYDDGKVYVSIRPRSGGGEHFRLYFPDMETAAKLADQIYHLQMDSQVTAAEAELVNAGEAEEQIVIESDR